MSTPVSIIIIAHHNSSTLSRALQGIDLHSRHGDQKILVLNNPSKEVELIAKSLDPNWLILYENEKAGPQHARNKGVQSAIHDYLVFLDDDIELSANWIERMLSKFTSPYIALGQGIVTFEKHKRFYWNYLRYKNSLYFYNQRREKRITRCDTAAVIVKKNWFEAVKGFSVDLNVGEDTYFAVKIVSHHGIIFTDARYFLTQIYSPHETFFGNLKKIKDSAYYVIQLRKKLYWRNYVSLRSFKLGKIPSCKRPISFWLIHFIHILFWEASLNRYREQLDPVQNKLLPTNSARLEQVLDPKDPYHKDQG